MYSILM